MLICFDFQPQEASANDAFRRAKQALTTLQQEANDDLPIGVAGFQAAKEASAVAHLNINHRLMVPLNL
jgi:hypothetical protein